MLKTLALLVSILLLDVATLWAVAHSVGMELAPPPAFISFVLASVVATLSPVPLGLGTFEGTCIGLLHVMGSSIESSLAATLIFRGFILWLPTLPGLWLMRLELPNRDAHSGGRD
nr:lysylphosphatidylglycerol synthetase family protein [Rhizobium sp. TCK]